MGPVQLASACGRPPLSDPDLLSCPGTTTAIPETTEASQVPDDFKPTPKAKHTRKRVPPDPPAASTYKKPTWKHNPPPPPITRAHAPWTPNPPPPPIQFQGSLYSLSICVYGQFMHRLLERWIGMTGLDMLKPEHCKLGVRLIQLLLRLGAQAKTCSFHVREKVLHCCHCQ